MSEFNELRESVEKGIAEAQGGGTRNPRSQGLPPASKEFRAGKSFATLSKEDIKSDVFEYLGDEKYRGVDWSTDGDMYKGFVAGFSQMIAKILAQHGKEMAAREKENHWG